jgi:O-antigen/teichoic acid export membrane protein
VAWIAGVGLALVLGAGAPVWQDVFNTASPWPFVVLAAGLPCYLAQSVGRGALQGTLRFEALALTFLVEMVVRLVVGILLVALGYGVMGATIGLSLSLVATWAVVAVLVGRVPAQRVADALSGTELRTYAGLVSVLLLAQIVANNSDVLVAKASLSPEAAGVYAAVALVGRAIFYLAWSVATVVFPVAAAAEPGKSGVLRGGLLIVGALGSACALGGLLVGGPILEIVLGEDYGGVSRLLAGYAVATTLFALANLAASVRLAQGRVDASWLVMAGAVLQVALLLALRGDATELVWAQVVAMTALVVGVSSHHALVVRREQRPAPDQPRDQQQGGPQR